MPTQACHTLKPVVFYTLYPLKKENTEFLLFNSILSHLFLIFLILHFLMDEPSINPSIRQNWILPWKAWAFPGPKTLSEPQGPTECRRKAMTTGPRDVR